ncbi:methyltransferase domain-containing protein [Micromonospora fiedleri]|uniref:Methyltransferase domain-containing protein n=1 Tax=Micromonospora fiedleri TaxID=1157498 RepID=A0ABS1UUX0_9ACTN|nr:methyltransferase domain-containing protein [Micromonospora fiedleri]MBL6280170.1 methyltransferase domain-containing protein [Micromonospora fiedleri]
MTLPLHPLSDCYGYDRGTPVDRLYIDVFLTHHRELVHGDAAEIKDDTYLRRYGADRLTSTTIIDIDPTNVRVTLQADLTAPGSLPPAAFDCLILTQTLQLLSDPTAALSTCHSALRPGGTLLLTVPSLARISPSGGPADRWRFTPAGLRHLFTAWPGPTQVTGYGNLRTCLAALLGEAAEELTETERTHHDPRFPLLAAATAHRAAEEA